MKAVFLPTSPRRVMAALLVMMLAAGILVPDADARRGKKDDDAAAQAQAVAEFQKELDPVNKLLESLLKKMQARSLFSPADAGKLAQVKYTLLDLMDKNPNNAMLAKPIYQAGVLYSEREAFNDAYELLTYLTEAYPGNPYGTKAKSKLDQLRKQYGEKYFPKPDPLAVEPPPKNAAATNTP